MGGANIAVFHTKEIAMDKNRRPTTSIFQRTEMSLGGPTYRIGRVREAVKGKDGLVRKLILEYKNANEKVFRTTDRNPRQTAILHRESEVELTQQLNIAAKEANLAVMGKSTS